jgi:sugar/nucleoside kinase (ribokinase family)
LVEHVDVFLPSLNEAQALTGATSAEDCLEGLFARCPSCVIVKMGEGGSLARTADGVFWQPAFPVSPVDTTGAGDSFNAGVVFGLLMEWAIPKTLRFANAVAALVISRSARDESRYPTFGKVADRIQNL